MKGQFRVVFGCFIAMQISGNFEISFLLHQTKTEI